MAFEYAPTSLNGSGALAHERLFVFRADSVGVAVPFLLAGSVNEPRVALDTARVDFGKCLVGKTRRERVTLTNHESVPFKFHFDPFPGRADGDAIESRNIVTSKTCAGGLRCISRIAVKAKVRETG